MSKNDSTLQLSKRVWLDESGKIIYIELIRFYLDSRLSKITF